MIILPGYEISEQIYEGSRTVVYRGKRNQDRQSVIIKIIKDEYPTIEQIARLRQEFTIIQILDSPGIVKAYTLEKYQNSFALILEDFGGQSICQLFAGNKLSLIEFLNLAISLAEALTHIHKAPIIHKDIKPANIVINKSKKQIKLIDFGLASRL